MAKTRKRTRRPSSAGGPSRPKTAPAAPERPRGALLRRAALLAVALVLGWVLFVRAPGPGTISAAAREAAVAAGCDDLERPVMPNPSRAHLAPGEGYTYPDPPPAAGPHDPTPLPPDPHVYAEPVPETRAVHNLEHAYVLIWYRVTAEGGLSSETVDALEAFANDQSRVIMAPYPTMPAGRSLALVAWNTRWMCPSGVTPEQAVAIATGFVDAYRGTTNAPEAPRGLLGPLFSR